MRVLRRLPSFLRALLCCGMVAGACAPAGASGVLTFGDQDVLGTGTYASDPTAGATLQGLAPGVVTKASLITGHSFAFSPSGSDHAGTDQIYVGSTQTAFRDGYSSFSGRMNAPQVITLDFTSLVPAGSTLVSLTLGIAADDFQNVPFGNPFAASINGTAQAVLTATLNDFDQTGPVVQFFTIGLDTSLDDGSHVLTLSIEQGGDGGDGWAIDFVTVGVVTRDSGGNVPEPASLMLVGAALLAAGVRRRRR